MTAPGGAAATYVYDGAGNVLSRTDANDHVSSYGYDAANRMISKTLPLNRVWTYAYDAAGNLTQTVDANGNATQPTGDGTATQTWDRAGRLAAMNYSDATPDVTFAYDGVANRTQMVDGAGTQTYTYDSVNRLKTVVRGSDTFSYNYDLAGNLTRRTYPDGTITDYTYDADSRLATAVSGGQTTSYGYDAAGNVLTTTLPAGNGHVEERTYDRAGHLTRVKNVKGANTLVDFTYTLDPVGNPTQVVRGGSAAGTTTYTYDARDRLTEVCFQASCPGGGDPFIRWTYDGVGNRLTQARPTGTTNYTYNAADQLTQAGSTTYTYDANGNQTAAGTTTFTYDLANRLKMHVAGTTTTAFTYDGDGARRQASTGSQASKKTNFLWDVNYGLPQVALERDGNNALLRRYVYGERRISMTSGGSASYYHYDSLGSVASLSSSAGATQWTWAYEPYGAIRTETKASGTQPINFMKFAGEYFDSTGLYDLRARQYDVTSGRFLSLDPLTQDGHLPGESAYVYVGDRPTAFIDPSGARLEPPGGAQQAVTKATSPAQYPGQGSLTDDEYEYCALQPWHALQCQDARDLADVALQTAVVMFPSFRNHPGGYEDDEADAFRHCYWSGLMTLAWDRETAKGFGDRHEAHGPSSGETRQHHLRARAMDQHNNGCGRDFASALGGGLTAQNTFRLRRLCFGNALRGGKLDVIVRRLRARRG